MIRLLLALHPRSWRADYGEELRDLLAAAPLTTGIVVDVLRNAGRQHVRAHPLAARVALALVLSTVVEVWAVHAQVTDNVLWPPTTPVRALALGALLLCWAPVTRWLGEAARRHRARASDRAPVR